MENIIYLTSLQERQRFNTELGLIFENEINEFKGQVLISWSSEVKKPSMNINFVNSLPDDKRRQLKNLIESLK